MIMPKRFEGWMKIRCSDGKLVWVPKNEPKEYQIFVLCFMVLLDAGILAFLIYAIFILPKG